MQETTISKNPLTEKGNFEEIYVSKEMEKTYAVAISVYLKYKK